MALPLFGASRAAAVKAPRRPRRMVVINYGLGLHGPFFFPSKAGRDYPLSPYLEIIKEFRQDFTVFSGLSHKGPGERKPHLA
jgi:hypothetical protein